jgi:hypothetical protein
MSAVVAVCLWIIAAKVLTIFPSRDHHWRLAYVLIAIGLPILAWAVVQHGLLFGAVALAAGAWVLRWPVLYFGRWLRRLFGGGEG